MLTTTELLAGCEVRLATLARLANVSRAALTRYAKGEREPELAIADRLAELTQHKIHIVDGAIRFSPCKKRGRKSA